MSVTYDYTHHLYRAAIGPLALYADDRLSAMRGILAWFAVRQQDPTPH